ncbi:acetoacetate decarboxylase family protein, partial [Nocardioides sp.]|uniref:acetoacetate decarboxylase family protein n=1 Tax=Nocardioides sp. TaxID=35761 RepID=UPI002734150F
MTGSHPADAPSSADQVYPPEPWDLRGSGQLSLWRLPSADLPDLPAGARPLTVRGQALACSAFVQYDETGLLPYSELLAGVVVRSPVGTGLSITHIWVDSPTSQAGGRELWGIPKQLAEFGDPDHDERSATVRGEEIASARFLPARPPALPLPIPLPARTIQTLAGATVASRLLMRGRLRWARATWDLPAGGELA